MHSTSLKTLFFLGEAILSRQRTCSSEVVFLATGIHVLSKQSASVITSVFKLFLGSSPAYASEVECEIYRHFDPLLSIISKADIFRFVEASDIACGCGRHTIITHFDEFEKPEGEPENDIYALLYKHFQGVPIRASPQIEQFFKTPPPVPRTTMPPQRDTSIDSIYRRIDVLFDAAVRGSNLYHLLYYLQVVRYRPQEAINLAIDKSYGLGPLWSKEVPASEFAKICIRLAPKCNCYGPGCHDTEDHFPILDEAPSEILTYIEKYACSFWPDPKPSVFRLQIYKMFSELLKQLPDRDLQRLGQVFDGFSKPHSSIMENHLKTLGTSIITDGNKQTEQIVHEHAYEKLANAIRKTRDF